MNLWATWCPPCRAEMPDLQRLYQTYRSRDVVVLGVDQGESGTRAAAFAQSLGIHYPILIDEQQQYGRVYAALGMPTTIVVDQDGIVVRGFDGALSYDQMVEAISPLVDKRS
jgi:thiol-disulfide isomerase/thioredoxin